LSSPGESSPFAINTAQNNMPLTSIRDIEHTGRKPISGARVGVGCWQVEENAWVKGGIRDWGAEAVFFAVGHRSATFMDNSTVNIARPFFDVNDRQLAAFVVAAPGLASGGVQAHASVNTWGSEANVWKNLYFNYPGTTFLLNAMAGFRNLNLDQALEFGSISVFNQNLAAFPTFLPF